MRTYMCIFPGLLAYYFDASSVEEATEKAWVALYMGNGRPDSYELQVIEIASDDL